MKLELLLLLIAVLILIADVDAKNKKRKKVGGKSRAQKTVGIGGHCEYGSGLPDGNGDWKYDCPRGTTCLEGACNCDDLPDGTITSISGGKCKRIAGQKCVSSRQCFTGVSCLNRVCTCPKDPNFRCIDKKNILRILD